MPDVQDMQDSELRPRRFTDRQLAAWRSGFHLTGWPDAAVVMGARGRPEEPEKKSKSTEKTLEELLREIDVDRRAMHDRYHSPAGGGGDRYLIGSSLGTRRHEGARAFAPSISSEELQETRGTLDTLVTEEPKPTHRTMLYTKLKGLETLLERLDHTIPEQLWKAAGFETRKRIEGCIGKAYRSQEYSDDVFMKIKETITDLAKTAWEHGISPSAFYDFLTPVRLLNEAVYKMDDSIESNGSVNNGAIGFRSRMFWAANRFITRMNRPDMVKMLPQIMYTIETSAAREMIGMSNAGSSNAGNSGAGASNGLDESYFEYITECFKDFLEPSNFEYLDTGWYGSLFARMFERQVADKNRFRLIWNTRCRATDVIDGLIDLQDDLAGHVFSPLMLYIYHKATGYDEPAVIKESVSAGLPSQRFDEIVQNYSEDLLTRLGKYVDRVEPRSAKVRNLKERTYEIVGLGLRMVHDPAAVSAYHEFYRRPLV